MNHSLIGLTAAVLLAGATLGPGVADAAAINLTDPGQTISGATLTLGFQFTLGADQTITALGVYDEAGDGLLWDAPVGLWDADGVLLASTVVGKGLEGGPLDGLFRYKDIGPITLHAGGHYTVGAYYIGDFAGSLGTGFGGAGTVDKRIILEGDRYANSSHFERPGATEGTGGAWLGANFKLADAVPEPGSWALMIAGFGLVGGSLRARRRSVLA